MYELCCDMIDLLINMSEIYGQPNGNIIQSIEDEEILNGEQYEFDSEPEDNENNGPLINGDHFENENSNPNSEKQKNNFQKDKKINLFRSFRYNTSDITP
jgi:DNA replication protein DnaD